MALLRARLSNALFAHWPVDPVTHIDSPCPITVELVALARLTRR